MPARKARGGPTERWVGEVGRFLRWKRTETSVGDAWISRMRWELVRFPSLVAAASPGLSPSRAQKVTPEMISTLRRTLPWERETLALHFAALRQFLRWARNPVADRKSLWSLPSGEPTHRRWLTKDQFIRLYRSSSGPGRLLVGLEGLNGLRRVEVLRLRARDVGLDEGCLRVLGKGRDGGKWRTIPIHPSLIPLLATAVRGCEPTARLIPLSKTGADILLTRTAAHAGLGPPDARVSHHDLRRTFGRLAHEAGMDLIQLKNMYGHASVEMTVHYIGLDSDRMRSGLQQMRKLVAV